MTAEKLTVEQRTKRVIRKILEAEHPVSIRIVAESCGNEVKNFVGNTVIINMQCLHIAGRESNRGSLEGALLYYPDWNWINPDPKAEDPEESCCGTCTLAKLCNPSWRISPPDGYATAEEDGIGINSSD